MNLYKAEPSVTMGRKAKDLTCRFLDGSFEKAWLPDQESV